MYHLSFLISGSVLFEFAKSELLFITKFGVSKNPAIRLYYIGRVSSALGLRNSPD